MNLKKLININFWRFDHKHYKDLYDYDIRFNASFRNTEKLSKDVLRSYELKCLSLYRKAQVAQGAVWGKYYFLNSDAVFGDCIFLTHGVTIGRDVRGRRKGAPAIGNNVCIRANSTVVGKITIGDDVLIAPNTFVNFDVPSHSVVVGSPGVIHHRDFATEGHLGIVKE